ASLPERTLSSERAVSAPPRGALARGPRLEPYLAAYEAAQEDAVGDICEAHDADSLDRARAHGPQRFPPTTCSLTRKPSRSSCCARRSRRPRLRLCNFLSG